MGKWHQDLVLEITSFARIATMAEKKTAKGA
jgi:hypothetical protein